MAPRLSGLQWLTNPYQLATLLLGSVACLLTVTTIPPSSVIYLIRADYSSSHGGDVVSSTAWLSNLGYCTSDANIEALPSNVRCSNMVVGYDVERALERDGTTVVSVGEDPRMSTLLTAGPAILNPIAIVLCLLSLAAYQAILRRPRGVKYAISMGASLLALIASVFSFAFEHSLEEYVASGHPAAGASFTTTRGPLSHAAALALCLQTAACMVGFYACIGGKYECEGGIRLPDEEGGSGAGVEKGIVTISHMSLDEKL